MGQASGTVGRERTLHLWELASDFGEGVPISKEAWIARYPKYQTSSQSWQHFRYKGTRLPLGFMSGDECIIMYHGTARECAKILDNYIVKYERSKADRICKHLHHVEAAYAGKHRDVPCPICKAPEGLSCEDSGGRLTIHIARIVEALKTEEEEEE